MFLFQKIWIYLFFNYFLIGFDRNIFFEKCAGKNNLLFLVKDEKGDEFGGYMSSKLEKNIYDDELIIKDNNAFIFNIKNKKKFKVVKPELAINIRNNYLIAFGGNCQLGNDFYIFPRKNGGMNRTEHYEDKKYETTNCKKVFQISEFKVYYINL